MEFFKPCRIFAATDKKIPPGAISGYDYIKYAILTPIVIFTPQSEPAI